MVKEHKQGFDDFISFIDDNGKQANIYVKLIDNTSFFVQFKTKDGNIISIPQTRVLKIKQKEGNNDRGQ